MRRASLANKVPKTMLEHHVRNCLQGLAGILAILRGEIVKMYTCHVRTGVRPFFHAFFSHARGIESEFAFPKLAVFREGACNIHTFERLEPQKSPNSSSAFA